MLRIVLFGLPSIVLDEKLVTGFMSQKAFLLFCYLVLEKDCSHPREMLSFLLWGDKPDARAKANLRQALQNLRQILPGCLITTRTTVSFDATQPHWLDVEAFQTLLTHPDMDLAQMEMTINLYQGELLKGVYVDRAPELDEWLNQKREDCQRLFVAVHEKLVQHYMRQGKWWQATDLVQRVLEIEPWREASHQQLMRLLARQGDCNAALTQYKVCCQVLKTELGIEPAPETVALYEHIQRMRTAQRPLNLPPAFGVFVGRQAELNRLSNYLRDPDCRLITLLGPGGIGKTRLALALADKYWREFIDGVCYVALGPAIQADFMVAAIAEAARIQFSGAAPPHEQLIAALAEQELLLLLDGFEHLMAGTDLVVDILHAAPQIKIIITSREKLALQEEWVFIVEGLSMPPKGQLDITELERYDAVACLVQRAIQQRNDFTLRGQEEAIVRLCCLLGGLPLGIELAAILLPVFSCAQIAVEVERNLDVLAATRHSMPERHRSLRAVFEQSWQMLSVDEQQIFPCLSVFRGGFTLEAAQQVANADLAVLSRLVAKSLLRVAASDEDLPPRYDIHETLRQYAQEVLDSKPEQYQQVQVAHTTYYARMMERQGSWWLEDNRQAPAVLGSEIDNIRLAWQRAVRYRDMKAMTQMMYALSRFYEMRGWYQEMNDMYAPALESLPPLETPEEQLVWGYLMATYAWTHLYFAKPAEAFRLAQQAVGVLRQHKPSRPLAHALNVLGVVQCNTGDYGIGREILQESLDIYNMLGCWRECHRLLSNLGLACMHIGDYESAQKFMEKGLALCYQEGIHQGVLYLLNNLGRLHYTLGDLATARRYYEDALPACDEVGLLPVKRSILLGLAEVDVRQEKFEQTLVDCQMGMPLFSQAGDRQSQATGLMWQGIAHHGLGDETSAYRCIWEGLGIALKLQHAPIILALLIGGAVLLLDSDYHEKGIDLLMMVTQHPATIQNHRSYAQELLARQGITLPDGVICQEDRSLADVAAALLIFLKQRVSTSN